MYNLVIITPDQMRADYLGCYGHPSIGTRNLDHLAEEGVRFDQCYCAAPLCGPSRISFATSTYFSEHNHRNYGSTISPSVPNLITSLKQAGYRTGMFGKNHLFTYGRLGEVWDSLDEICLGNCDNHEKYDHSFTSFTMEEDHPYNITGRLTTETIDFMEQTEGPFVAWVNYQDPHPAFACPKPYDTLFDPKDVIVPQSFYGYQKEKEPVRNEVWRIHSEMELCGEEEIRKAISMYMGQIRYVDDSVGRIMEYLEQAGKKENTLVVFFSDHGELLGNHGMTHKNPTFYDCLSRIPVIMRFPDGAFRGTTFRGLVEEVDLSPTILEALGIDIPRTMVGTSWLSALKAGDDSGKETVLCEAGVAAPTCRKAVDGMKIKAPFAPTSYGCGAMIRKGDWKLSLYTDDRGELYHVTEDPEEMENRYEDPSCMEIRQELTLLLCKRIMGVKVREIRSDAYPAPWDPAWYPVDVRQEPLECGQ